MENRPCGFLIKQIHDNIEKNVNNRLRKQDMTLSQINMLLMLNKAADKRMTMKDIEKYFGVAQSTVAGIISRLEKKGFVQCSGDDIDKRIKIAAITELGQGCCKDAEKHITETEHKLLSNLNDEEKVLFNTLLQKVSKSLN